MFDLSSASEASRAALIDCQVGGRGLGRFAHRGDLGAGGGEAFVVGDGARLQRRDRVSLVADFVAHLLDAVGEGAVGFLDLAQVVGPGDQILVAAGAEDDAGGARASRSRRSPPGAGPGPGGSGAAAPSRPPVRCRVFATFRRQLGGALPRLRPAGRRAAARGLRPPRLRPGRSAAVRCSPAARRRSSWLRRAPRRAWLRAQPASAAPRARRDREHGDERAAEQRGGADAPRDPF